MEGRSNPIDRGSWSDSAVDGYKDAFGEIRKMGRPMHFLFNKAGFLGGIASIAAVGALLWYTFLEDPGTVASAEWYNPQSVGTWVSANYTRPGKNKLFGFLGSFSRNFKQQPQQQEPLNPIQQLPNAYATSQDDEQE